MARPGLTLEEARAQVLSHLDDEDGRRFAPISGGVQDFANVDRALRSSLSRCIDDMAGAGVERLVREIEVTSDTDGVADVSAYDPADVLDVYIIPSGTIRYRIEQGSRLDRWSAETTERSLVVRLRQKYDIPPEDADDELLLGRLDGEARGWPALDDWICARAALHVGIRDKDKREGLIALAADLERSVLRSPQTPRFQPYPGAAPYRSVYTRLRWLWDESARTVKLVIVDGWV
jgi:hypothetical protein